LLAAVVLLPLVSWPALAQQPPAADEPSDTPPSQPVSPTALRAKALTALQQGDYPTAVDAARAMLRQMPNDVVAARMAGDVYLRSGKVELATEQFNRFVKAEPAEMPYLWQRGISLYFTGDFAEAAKQFEDHRKVNPNDVENAAWHFLCVAKAKSFDEAKRLLLPAPGDPRIPMQEVLEMFSSGDTDSVVARMDAVGKEDRAYGSARFYGDFYLGLYADAQGDQEKALLHLKRSAKDAPHHYMGDVARVYAQFLQRKVSQPQSVSP
jgi:lipoprotein NlpI